MLCPHCGSQNESSAKFCVNCGGPLPTAGQSAGGQQTSIRQAPLQWTPQSAGQNQPTSMPSMPPRPASDQSAPGRRFQTSPSQPGMFGQPTQSTQYNQTPESKSSITESLWNPANSANAAKSSEAAKTATGLLKHIPFPVIATAVTVVVLAVFVLMFKGLPGANDGAGSASNGATAKSPDPDITVSDVTFTKDYCWDGAKKVDAYVMSMDARNNRNEAKTMIPSFLIDFTSKDKYGDEQKHRTLKGKDLDFQDMGTTHIDEDWGESAMAFDLKNNAVTLGANEKRRISFYITLVENSDMEITSVNGIKLFDVGTASSDDVVPADERKVDISQGEGPFGSQLNATVTNTTRDYWTTADATITLMADGRPIFEDGVERNCRVEQPLKPGASGSCDIPISSDVEELGQGHKLSWKVTSLSYDKDVSKSSGE